MMTMTGCRKPFAVRHRLRRWMGR